MNQVKEEERRGKGSPAELLERVFAHIAATRMIGVPILNPALRVEAVGFRVWEGRWIGVLVTPWMINLVLLPGESVPLTPLAPGEKTSWDFPSGSYEFMGLNEPMLGACHVCSLMSPVLDFSMHEEAVSVAQEIIRALFVDVEETSPATIEEARLLNKRSGQMSRRDFLRLPLVEGR